MTSNKGDVIERIVRTKIGISELSRILHVSRTSIYNWFEHGHLNLETICKIGQAIDHDFTNEFPEEFAKAKNQVSAGFTAVQDFKNENCESSIHFWMNKYITLLEKYNELLTEIAKPDAKPGLKNLGNMPYYGYDTDVNDRFDKRDQSLSCI
ncbi:hypothetical protein [Pedobacter heparinus]|uniref:hypothetical protein n=1 Tax=Pedobacter heparinus TaxID=984 RepID=UPI00292EC81B|nr:hypothetical protein [Pedobacter heparinus]